MQAEYAIVLFMEPATAPDLTAFLARHAPLAEEPALWGATMPLRIRAYLSAELPPLAYVTSVRSLVFRGDRVLVLRNLDDTHILPGGRREPGESLEETLRREVLEETGWTIRAPALLGFLHLQHLMPQPDDYPYPQPDFVQVVYVSQADTYLAGARVPDGYELEAELRPVSAVLALPLTPHQRLFLAAALGRGAGGPGWRAAGAGSRSASLRPPPGTPPPRSRSAGP